MGDRFYCIKDYITKNGNKYLKDRFYTCFVGRGSLIENGEYKCECLIRSDNGKDWIENYIIEDYFVIMDYDECVKTRILSQRRKKLERINGI